MDLRDEGGFSPAEGCIFGAVALFAILLVALIYLAAVRFRNDRPTQEQMGRPRAAIELMQGSARG